MAAYVLQTLYGGCLDDFVNVTRACIEQQEWLTGEKNAVFYSSSGNYFRRAPNEKEVIFVPRKNGCIPQAEPFIPVGSVEFVETFLRGYYGKESIAPINIPPQLMDKRFTRRKVAYISNESEVELAFSELGTERLFVKQAHRCKAAPAGIYYPGEKGYATVGASYLVSEVLDFESEWRVFVFHKRIRDVRCYSGDPWKLPDKETVIDMVCNWNDAPPAYALDVGVTIAGDTVVVEAHNFVSCGLYGFADATVLPQMTSAGFKYEAGLLRRPETAK